MYGHSMGGSQLSQSVLNQIKRGRIIGFTAGTDNHVGAPASYGEGLTAVYAEELTRPSVFRALQSRHTYAVTGDRIGVRMQTEDGGIMGDILPAGTPRHLEIDIQGCTLLDYVELFRNGLSVEKWNPLVGEKEPQGPYLLRFEFGWGGLNDTRQTRWRLDLRFHGAKILAATPYFCYGPQTTEAINKISQKANRLEVDAVSTRSNAEPTQTVLLELEGLPAAELRYDITAGWGDDRLSASGIRGFSELLNDDWTVEMAEVFSAPKLKIHRLLPAQAAQFSCSWQDPLHGDASPASYFVKVVQKNGHMAWSSPVWYR
jgi:hypothetical protein